MNVETGLGIVMLAVVSITGLSFGAEPQDLVVTHSQVRDDKYEVPLRDFQWTEGWAELDQFYPRHYEPACALHMFLKNTGDKDINVTGLQYNGKPIAEVCTNPDRVGPVIWYRANLEKISAGGTAMVIVRMRKKLTAPVTIGAICDNGQSVSAQFKPTDYSKLRIVSAAFDLKQNKMFVYVKKYSDDQLSLKRCLINGDAVEDSRCLFRNRDFKGNHPAYIEINPETQLRFGQFLVLTVEDDAGNAAVYQLRVRNDKIGLGIIGQPKSIKEKYDKKFFNMLVQMGSTAAKIKEDFWEHFEDNDYSYVQTANTEEYVKRVVKHAPKERFAFGTIDEPDGVDCIWYGKIPQMQRCGVNIMQVLEPWLSMARKYAPEYLTQTLVDRTYAPSNWFIYGETMDLCFNDCYPLYHHFASDALEDLPPQVSTVMNAAAPRPVHMVLWGCQFTGKMPRAYTPLENDMQVHYAIGSGAKGITYFLDRNAAYSYGHYYAASRIKPLWDNIGRLNAKMTRIAPLLNAGCPVDIVKSSDKSEMWVKSLQCGKDSFVIVAVNRNYKVHGYGKTKIPWIFPVEDEVIEVTTPEWINKTKVVEVSWDKVEDVKVVKKNGKLIIPVKDMMESRIYVVSLDQNIASRLGLDKQKLAAMVESEKPAPRTGQKLDNVRLQDAPIKLTPEQVAKKSFTLDFNKLEDIKKAISFDRVLAEVDLVPDTGLALFPFKEDRDSRCELVYCFESDVLLSNIKVTLAGTTPNLSYCAANMIELSSTEEFDFLLDSKTFVRKTTFDPLWNGATSGDLNATLNEAMKKFYIKITMRDPELVWTGEYSNTIEQLTITWDVETK